MTAQIEAPAAVGQQTGANDGHGEATELNIPEGAAVYKNYSIWSILPNGTVLPDGSRLDSPFKLADGSILEGPHRLLVPTLEGFGELTKRKRDLLNEWTCNAGCALALCLMVQNPPHAFMLFRDGKPEFYGIIPRGTTAQDVALISLGLYGEGYWLEVIPLLFKTEENHNAFKQLVEENSREAAGRVRAEVMQRV